MKFNGGYSLHSFSVALRWAMVKGFPICLGDWTQEQYDTVEAVAKEADRRRKNRPVLQVVSIKVNDDEI